MKIEGQVGEAYELEGVDELIDVDIMSAREPEGACSLSVNGEVIE